MNVILCGYHWTGCKALELLLKQAHRIFVFTHKNPHHIPSLEKYCQKANISYSLENISSSELPFEADLICSIYYRNLISKKIIESCQGRIFNLHPSLLPKYRGCSSLTWAMINGEKEVGYTYHYVQESFDTGNIIIQKSLAIEDWDTQETLYTRVMFEAMKDFNKAIELVISGYSGKPQAGDSSYFPRGSPHRGKLQLDWNVDYKERFIRAMIYPPYPLATYENKEISDISQLDQI